MKAQLMAMPQSEQTSSEEAEQANFVKRDFFKPFHGVSNTLLCTDAHVVYTPIGAPHIIAVLPLNNWPHTVNATPQVSVAHKKAS